jgi:hypothetical protein
MDYSWHVQHLLREFGCGQYALPIFVQLRGADRTEKRPGRASISGLESKGWIIARAPSRTSNSS